MSTGKRRRGPILLNSRDADAHLIERFVRGAVYRDSENGSWRLSQGARRTELYEFRLHGTDREVMMKVSLIPREYSWSRKIESLVKALWRDYGRMGFLGALALQEAGIRGLQPLAAWRDRFFSFARRSYFLYEKAPADLSLATFLEQEPDLERRLAIARRVAKMIRTMHDARVRHGDLIARNILLQRTDDNDFDLVLIDTDKTRRFRWRLPFISRFRDIGDLADADFHPHGRKALLRDYLDRDSSLWWWVLKFWFYGGYSPARWRHRRKERIESLSLRPDGVTQ